MFALIYMGGNTLDNMNERGQPLRNYEGFACLLMRGETGVNQLCIV